MRKLIVPLALLVMAVVLGLAIAIDCAHLAADKYSRVLVADGQMVTQEIRLVNVLSNSAKMTPEVQSAITTLKAIHSRKERMEAYDALVGSFQKTMADKVDATNPLDRKFMDDAAGAINRRNVAQKQYDEEAAEYHRFLSTWRGRAARYFYAQARKDASE